MALHCTGKSEYDKIQKNIENSYNIFYRSNDSSSFKTLDVGYGVRSEMFYLNDLNNYEKKCNLTFNMKNSEKKAKVYGTIYLYYIESHYDDNEKYFFKELKENGLINDFYMTFLYDEYKFDFNYLDDNYDKTLGHLILGESPKEFNPQKFKKEDEIRINSDFLLFININEIKFKSNTSTILKKILECLFILILNLFEELLGLKMKLIKFFSMN